MAQLKIAYLISQYPAVSHTFILREVRRLRTLGMRIFTSSINTPDRPIEDLDADEREEAESTYYVKEHGFIYAATLLIKSLFTSPIRFVRSFVQACRLAGSNPRRLVKHFAYLGEAALLGDWMLSQDLTHVHVHFANPASTVALLACSLYPLTYSMTVHGPDEFYDVTANSLPQKIIDAQFINCISYYAQSQLMKLSPVAQWSKFKVLRLGVDTDIFTPSFDPVPSGRCRIVCVGRLVPAKGQHILLSAFAQLIRNGKDASLHFIGGGPDRTALETEVQQRKLQGKVSFSGPLNPWQVVEAYRFADVLALASFAEGLPVVLMEAMAMEIPCVATWVNGIPEMIRHNVEGLLVAPSSTDQLAQTLELLVDDAGLRDRLGKAGRERIQEHYNLEKNVEALYEHFESVLS